MVCELLLGIMGNMSVIFSISGQWTRCSLEFFSIFALAWSFIQWS